MQSTTQGQARVNKQGLSVLIKQNSQECSESYLGTQTRSASTRNNTLPKRLVFNQTKERKDLKPLSSQPRQHKDTIGIGLHSQKGPKSQETQNFKISLGIRYFTVQQQACIRECAKGNTRIRDSLQTNLHVYVTVCRKKHVYKGK